MNGNYGWGLPVAASSFAKDMDYSLNVLHIAMIAIFVLWAIFFGACLMRYRARPGHAAEYPRESRASTLGSFVPDGVILAFEIWLIFIFGLPIWAHVKEEFPEKEASTHVRIVSEQFNWNVHYPGPDGVFGRMDPALVQSANPLGLDPGDPAGADDVLSVNELRAPLGKPILIDLTSRDVIHSFFIPEFRIKQDAVPGMMVPVWVEPILAGRFEIGCAQLCGVGHYRMRGDVVVGTPDEFEAWYASMRRPPV